MAYEEKTSRPKAHNLILEGRERLSLTSVEEVGSFDEECIVLTTSAGELTVRGSGLHIEKLSIDSGEALILGRVEQLDYSDSAQRGGGFWSRLMK